MRPALFDVVLFREHPAGGKMLSVQMKEKYFCIQLLAVTCLPFFRALARCHPQARRQQTSFPLLRGSSDTRSARPSPCPHNSNREKENAAKPACEEQPQKEFHMARPFFSILIHVFPKLQNSSTELTHLHVASIRFTKNPVFKVTNRKSRLLVNTFTNEMNLEPVQTYFI